VQRSAESHPSYRHDSESTTGWISIARQADTFVVKRRDADTNGSHLWRWANNDGRDGGRISKKEPTAMHHCLVRFSASSLLPFHSPTA
jgi:hypothetical protein